MQVVSYFSDSVEKEGSPPFSSSFVLDTIKKSSLSWPKNRLRVSCTVPLFHARVNEIFSLKKSYCK